MGSAEAQTPRYMLCLLSLISVLFTVDFVRYAANFSSRPQKLSYHIGRQGTPDPSANYHHIHALLAENIERTLMLPGDGLAKMVLQETTRFNFSTPEGNAEAWANFPRGTGTYRLSHDNYRVVFTSLYHQLHCADTFGMQLVKTKPYQFVHIEHCTNLLRTMALCRPDLTLEPGDFTKRNFELQRVGPNPHVCRDWIHVNEYLTEDWKKWMLYWAAHVDGMLYYLRKMRDLTF